MKLATSGLLALCAGALLLNGCPKKPVAKPQPTPVAVAPTPVPEARASYVVRSGDSLWKISARKKTLGDPFRWPLLYKANRDQIEDPDLIEPKQDLGYKKEYSRDEVDDAVQKAKETPPYVPHATPRKSLPVKY